MACRSPSSPGFAPTRTLSSTAPVGLVLWPAKVLPQAGGFEMPSGAGSWARRPGTSGSQPLELGDCRLCQLRPLPRRGLRATAGIWGTTQGHWEAPRLPLSVSGLHPGSNLCICCQLQLCPRHRAQRPSHIDADALLHASQRLHQVGTNNSPFFQGGN